MTTGDEVDISTRAAQLFMAPSTHCEGGEDAVILVETDGDESGQHLVSARVDGSAKKRLCPVSCSVFVCIVRDPSYNTFLGWALTGAPRCRPWGDARWK